MNDLIIKRNTYAEVDLEAIKANYQYAVDCSKDSNNIAVIKANAYGHGAVATAKALEDLVPAFAVAVFSEAIELRDAGISKPILIFQGAQTVDELIYASRNDFLLCIYSVEQVELIRTTSISNPVTLWFKLDTGLHRLGLSIEQIKNAFIKLSGCPWINEQRIIYTHLSSSDESKSDESELQMEKFNYQVQDIEVDDDFFLEYSIANSSGIVGIEESHRDWNRPGIMLYGMKLFDCHHECDDKLQPAMSFYSSIIGIRNIPASESVGYNRKWTADNTSAIATIAVGYADGYPRHAKNGTPVLINGKRVPLVGRVSMDLISVDVTELENVKVGDSVELWGKNLPAFEVAKWAETISYDLLTGVSSRVPRKYITQPED